MTTRLPLVTCPLTATERAIFDEMKARASVRSDTDLVRLGLVKVALQFGIPLTPTDFHQRGYARTMRRRDRR